MSNQAAGLERLFSNQGGMEVVCILASPNAGTTGLFTRKLAIALSESGNRVCLVATGRQVEMAQPIRRWQRGKSLEECAIVVDGYDFLHAPGIDAGEEEILRAATTPSKYDFFVFDGGNFTSSEAPINPCIGQWLILLTNEQDVASSYALIKGLCLEKSEIKALMLGEGGEQVAQLSQRFLDWTLEICKPCVNVCQNNNGRLKSSSNTLTIDANLTWVLSRIQSKNRKGMANGGACKNSG